MKQAKKKLTAFFLSVMCLMSCVVLAGCGDNTPPVMYYGSTEISLSMYRYWMSAYKSYFLQILGGEDTEEFLNAEYDIQNEDGEVVTQTVANYLNDQILSVIRSNCISLYLFDEYKLSLPDSTVSAVESAIESEIANAGSRKALNEALAPIGLNVNLLKDMFLAEEKINYLYSYLYGDESLGEDVAPLTAAEPITDDQYDAFYQSHYVCVKHIYIRTADKNVLDDEGNVQYDDEGYVVTAELTEEEAAAKYALCDEIEQMILDGADFDTLIEEYSEDSGRYTYTDGYVVSRSSSLPEAFLSNAFDMQIGEIRRVDASYATHIMLRLELPEKGWLDDTILSMMDNFKAYVKSEVFAEKIAPYVEQIVYDEDLLSEYTIYNIPTTSY